MATQWEGWFRRTLVNLEQGNYREALYCSDQALYELQCCDLTDQERKLVRVLRARGTALLGLARTDEADQCFKRADCLEC